MGSSGIGLGASSVLRAPLTHRAVLEKRSRMGKADGYIACVADFPMGPCGRECRSHEDLLSC